MSEPRKASDILLSLEEKLDQLIKLSSNVNLNYGVISNKLNEIMNTLKEHNITSNTNVDVGVSDDMPEPSISVSNEFVLPMQKGPQQSFGRTSRSETFENIVPNPTAETPKTIKVPTTASIPKTQSALPDKIDTSKKIPVEQRIVNKQGKAVFLANVDIIEVNSKEVVGKVRTNQLGKWSYVLPIGQYDVKIKKINVDTKETTEITQHLLVDGTQSPLTLDIAMIN